MKRNRNRNSALLTAGLLLLALFPGCKKEEAPPPPAPAATPKAPPAAVPQNAVQKPVSSAIKPPQAANPFDFKNRRDPFKPFQPVEQAPPKVETQAAAPKGDALPIQSYEANRFKVAGIVAGLKQNRALLLDPQGKPYVVHEGMALGSNDGHITRITASTVEVVERYKDDRGRPKTRKVVLTLPKKR